MTEPAKIKWVRYVLAVWNFTTSVNYYQQQLGFITWWAGDGWHFLKRQKYLVMLGERPEDRSAFETRNHSHFAYVDVESINDLYMEYKSRDVEILSLLKDKSWRQCEFSIRTIDGHRIMFGEEIKKL